MTYGEVYSQTSFDLDFYILAYISVSYGLPTSTAIYWGHDLDTIQSLQNF